MGQDAIDKIKEVERKGRGMIEGAKEDARRMIEEGQDRASRLLDEGRMESLREGEEIIVKVEAEAKKRVSEIASQNLSDREKIERASESNMEKAISYIIERVMGGDGHR